jgi:preprotein translocase subunit SecF
MINFLKYQWLYFLISTVVIGAGLFSIVKWGYRFSIDFVGGTNLEYQFNKDVSENDLRKALSQNIELVEFSKKNTIVSIRTKAMDEKKEVALKKDLENKLKTKIIVLRSETVGPTLGKETMNKTLIASMLGVIGILLYMTFAFKHFNFALSAVLAMIHDFFVVIGTYSLLSHFFSAEIDTMFVTAVLTTMSFSVHDTIVIFDKIREYRKHEGNMQPEYFANKALTETMVRSLNNSMTIVFMLLALVLMGGSTIRFFVLTLLIGTITGTYSSPFIATPILVWLEKRNNNKK